jgi:hypothetical protein
VFEVLCPSILVTASIALPICTILYAIYVAFATCCPEHHQQADEETTKNEEDQKVCERKNCTPSAMLLSDGIVFLRILQWQEIQCRNF